MVTNLRERGREQCVKYWPDEGDPVMMFPSLEIRPIGSMYYADYIVIILLLKYFTIIREFIGKGI